MPLSVKEFNKKILGFPISNMVLGYLLICLSTTRGLRYISNILRLPGAACETKYFHCSLQIYKRWFLSFVKYKERIIFKALNANGKWTWGSYETKKLFRSSAMFRDSQIKYEDTGY